MDNSRGYIILRCCASIRLNPVRFNSILQCLHGSYNRNPRWHNSAQGSQFNVCADFWSVWTPTWRFEDCSGPTFLIFDAVWTDRITQLGRVSLRTMLTDCLDVDVAFYRLFGLTKACSTEERTRPRFGTLPQSDF